MESSLSDTAKSLEFLYLFPAGSVAWYHLVHLEQVMRSIAADPPLLTCLDNSFVRMILLLVGFRWRIETQSKGSIYTRSIPITTSENDPPGNEEQHVIGVFGRYLGQTVPALCVAMQLRRHLWRRWQVQHRKMDIPVCQFKMEQCATLQ